MKPIYREVELYENERYQPIGGWGKQMLLTDRSPYSSSDGEANYSTLEEANITLLTTGWHWEDNDDWKIDPVSADEGWYYATDFGGDDQTYSATKGILHFVRRRRLIRLQSFAPDRLLGGIAWVCDNVDLEKVASLEKHLLHAIVDCSLQKHPRQFSEAKVGALKNHLMAALNLTGGPGEGALGMKGVQDTLASFAGSGGSIWTVASAALAHKGQEEVNENEVQRMHLFDSKFFRADEREALANALIHKHDTDFSFHCNVKNCNSSTTPSSSSSSSSGITLQSGCPYAPVLCTNKGCEVVFSKKWGANHDARCPYKVIDCSRTCGENMARKEVEYHISHQCILRPVQCPFACLGCNTDLLFKDLPTHMDDTIQPHMMMGLHRVMEQHEVIVKLNTKVASLESKTAAYGSQIAALTAGAAAAAVAMEVNEKKMIKVLHDEVGRVNAKATKKQQALESHTQQITNEMSQVRRGTGLG